MGKWNRGNEAGTKYAGRTRREYQRAHFIAGIEWRQTWWADLYILWCIFLLSGNSSSSLISLQNSLKAKWPEQHWKRKKFLSAIAKTFVHISYTPAPLSLLFKTNILISWLFYFGRGSAPSYENCESLYCKIFTEFESLPCLEKFQKWGPLSWSFSLFTLTFEALVRGAFFVWPALILSWPRIMCSQVRI